MRILHVLGKLDRGGVETWLVQVLRHIDRKKYQMDFLVHTTDPGAYDEEVRALGSPDHPVPESLQPDPVRDEISSGFFASTAPTTWFTAMSTITADTC